MELKALSFLKVFYQDSIFFKWGFFGVIFWPFDIVKIRVFI